MRKTALVLTLALLLSSSAAPAFAHAQLTGANPKGNSVIYAMPKFVTLLFDDDLMKVSPDSNQIQVTDSKGRRVDDGLTTVVGNKVQTALKAGLAAGIYKIEYRVVSADGHPVGATFKFTLAKKAKAK
jgi:methionine-rich copper-binding protein CopC